MDTDATSQYELTASKPSIYNDGGDFTTLTLTDADGNDVTELGRFYADDEPIEGNRFSTTKGSLTPVTISATVAGAPVKNTVAVTATSSYGFTSRVQGICHKQGGEESRTCEGKIMDYGKRHFCTVSKRRPRHTGY